jgi:hypothetical protein
MAELVTGQCLCGGVRFELTPPLRSVIVCHCGQCRRWHGHFGAYTAVPHDKLRFVEDQGLAWFTSSSFARRGFCRDCGSSLFWERNGHDSISITAGSLDAPTGLQTVLQIFAKDKGDYYELDRTTPVRTE